MLIANWSLFFPVPDVPMLVPFLIIAHDHDRETLISAAGSIPVRVTVLEV